MKKGIGAALAAICVLATSPAGLAQERAIAIADLSARNREIRAEIAEREAPLARLGALEAGLPAGSALRQRIDSTRSGLRDDIDSMKAASQSLGGRLKELRDEAEWGAPPVEAGSPVRESYDLSLEVRDLDQRVARERKFARALASGAYDGDLKASCASSPAEGACVDSRRKELGAVLEREAGFLSAEAHGMRRRKDELEMEIEDNVDACPRCESYEKSASQDTIKVAHEIQSDSTLSPAAAGAAQ